MKLGEGDKMKGNKGEEVKQWAYDSLLSSYWTDAPGKEKRKQIIQSNLWVCWQQKGLFARNKVLISGIFIAGYPFLRNAYGK